MPGYLGNSSELLKQLVVAFGGPLPTSNGDGELMVDLINAVEAFAGGMGGNAGWSEYTVNFGSGLAAGEVLTTTETGSLILNYLPITTTAFDGLTPQLDLFTGGTTGILASRGASPIPMWVPAVEPGGNTGLLVPGTPSGPRASQSYAAGLATTAMTSAGPPVLEPLAYVQAGGSLIVAVTQDGTLATPVAASLLATSAVTLPFTVTSSTNQLIWQGTDPALGGGGAAPLTFTVGTSYPVTFTTLIGPSGLEAAVNTATTTGSVPFSTYATCANNGSGFLTITDNGGGAAGNGNTFGPATNDITAGLGFTPPGLLEGGQGGNPNSTQGQATFLLNTANPQ